jgi:hypothetical protein
MGQTILAILALLVATLYSLGEYRGIHKIQVGMMRNEIALMGTGVAVDVLEEMGSMAYDEATVAGRIYSSSDLTPASNFGPGFDLPNNDIDDWHGADIVRDRTTEHGTLSFRVVVDVVYAMEDAPEDPAPDGVRTRFKKANVKVYSLDIERPDTIRIARSYACGSRCDW